MVCLRVVMDMRKTFSYLSFLHACWRAMWFAMKMVNIKTKLGFKIKLFCHSNNRCHGGSAMTVCRGFLCFACLGTSKCFLTVDFG